MVFGKPLTAITYSLSKITKLISPFKMVWLTRCKEKDSKLMKKILNQTDIVVCPKGTTCREPYLLSFSRLFAEMSDEIVLVSNYYLPNEAMLIFSKVQSYLEIMVHSLNR